MEMEMEVRDEMAVAIERLAAAAGVLEQAAERLVAVELQASHGLEERLVEAEATIAQLRAGGRKTVASGVMASKEGVALDAGSLDAALVSLSVEQRIAVKAGLLRSGLAG